MTLEDTVGRTATAGETVVLPALGNPLYLFTDRLTDGAEPLSGTAWLELLRPLDRREESFAKAGGVYELPAAWDGKVGNPAAADGVGVWRLDQIWPPDPARPDHYRPLIWKGTRWEAPADSFGGQPKAERRPDGLQIEIRAKHGTPQRERLAGLTFVAPEAGTYVVSGAVKPRFWDGKADLRIDLLRKNAAGAAQVGTVKVPDQQTTALPAVAVELAAGGELVFLPRLNGHFKGAAVTFSDLTVTRHPVVRK